MDLDHERLEFGGLSVVAGECVSDSQGVRCSPELSEHEGQLSLREFTLQCLADERLRGNRWIVRQRLPDSGVRLGQSRNAAAPRLGGGHARCLY